MDRNCTDPSATSIDRVSAYFEHVMGRPMTRDEKIPLGSVIHGEDLSIPEMWESATEGEDGQ